MFARVLGVRLSVHVRPFHGERYGFDSPSARQLRSRNATLVQSCLFEANSLEPALEDQWLASLDFPDLCTSHQSRRHYYFLPCVPP